MTLANTSFILDDGKYSVFRIGMIQPDPIPIALGLII